MNCTNRYADLKWVVYLLLFFAGSAHASSSLRLVSSDPINNGLNAARAGVVSVLTFNANLNATTVFNNHVMLHLVGKTDAEPVILTVSGNQITVQATHDLLPVATYVLDINGVQGIDGEQLSAAIRITFKTRDGSWRNAQRIGNGSTDYLYGYLMQVTSNKSGAATAIWSQFNATTKSVNLYGSYYSAGQWTTPQLISTDMADRYFSAPKIAMAEDGSAVAVWTEQYTYGYNNSSVHSLVWSIQYLPGQGWSQPRLMKSAPLSDSSDPSVAISQDGKAVVVWIQSMQSTRRLLSSRYTNDTGWSAAVPIDAISSVGSRQPRVVLDKRGYGYAVWIQSWHGANIVWANRYTPDRGWIAPQIIQSDKTTSSDDVQLAFDNNGNALALWVQGPKLYAARYVLDRGWNAAVEIVDDIEAPYYLEIGELHIVFDHAGNALAVWAQGGGVRAARYVRDQGWSAAVEVAMGWFSYGLTVVMNAQGDAFVSWTNEWIGEILPHNQYHMAYRVNAARFTAASGWEAPVQLEYDRTYYNYVANPVVAIDEAGNATAVWTGYNGFFDRIYAYRYQVGNGWVNRKVIDTMNVSGADYPHVVVDESGNALAVWQQADGLWSNRFE